MVNIKIFDSPGARYFVYGWGFLMSVFILIAGIWLDSITPAKCPNSSLRTGTRAMIVSGVVLTVIFASFWGCNSFCNVVDPTVINGWMMFLLFLGFTMALIYTSMALNAVKSSYMPSPPNNKCMTKNQADCQTDPNCNWDGISEKCNFNNPPCITNSYATTVLGILVAFEVFTIIMLLFITFVKWKMRGAPQREAKQKSDEEVLKKEKEKVKKEDVENKERKDAEELKKEQARIQADINRKANDPKLVKKLEREHKKAMRISAVDKLIQNQQEIVDDIQDKIDDAKGAQKNVLRININKAKSKLNILFREKHTIEHGGNYGGGNYGMYNNDNDDSDDDSDDDSNVVGKLKMH